MDSDTSIGPSPALPADGDARTIRETSEGVDAQNANEFDSRHGIAGIEGKPFSPQAPHPDGKQGSPAKGAEHREASSSGGTGADPDGHHEDANSNT